jgi:hypothetical protein
MQPPIIADNHGDVLVFGCVADAEKYVEPVDVKNGEYSFFDSEGRQLSAEIVRSVLSEKVRLRATEDTPTHQAELRDTLVGFLRAVPRWTPKNGH